MGYVTLRDGIDRGRIFTGQSANAHGSRSCDHRRASGADYRHLGLFCFANQLVINVSYRQYRSALPAVIFYRVTRYFGSAGCTLIQCVFYSMWARPVGNLYWRILVDVGGGCYAPGS